MRIETSRTIRRPRRGDGDLLGTSYPLTDQEFDAAELRGAAAE